MPVDLNSVSVTNGMDVRITLMHGVNITATLDQVVTLRFD
jgi:hypothetical protein